MKITAVVVTYNRIELLKECIEALLAQDYSDMDILIVDNHSTDGTIDYLKQSFPDMMSSSPLNNTANSTAPTIDNDISLQHHVSVQYLPANIGGSGGFYEGMKTAVDKGCDYVWVMDDDTIPEANACSELAKAVTLLTSPDTIIGSDHEKKIGFISCNVHGINGECMNTPRMPFKQKGKNGYADWNIHLDQSLVKVQSATFCACLISSDAVREVGLPIRDYFIWGDDTEYTLRLSRYYGQAWICGTSRVLHKRANGESLSIKKENNPARIGMYHYYVRNYLINLKLYYGLWASLGKIVHFKLIMLSILFSKSKYKWKKIITLAKGICEFVFGLHDTKAVKNRLSSYKATSSQL